MQIIQNRFSNLILSRGFVAVTVWPLVFVRTDEPVTPQLLRHERIHGRQQLEMLWLFFFLWYGIEWVVRLCQDRRTAYRKLSFEQEAYANEADPGYFAIRRPFRWMRYLP